MRQQSEHDQIGGAAGVTRLVAAFYRRMDTLPEAAAIRALHDDDLTADHHKLAAFLSGWLGGPPLYMNAWDAPTVRDLHRHLPIDRAAAEAWLVCMAGALEEVVDDPSLRSTLMLRFRSHAHGARNRGERPPPA